MKRFMLAVFFLSLPGLTLSAPFDRLFTTPTERALLDHLRQTTRPVNEAPLQSQAQEFPMPVSENISVQGYVKRSDGKKGTVWINHQPVQESRDAGAVISRNARVGAGEVELKVPATGRFVRLKPGQVYVPATGEIDDVGVSETGSYP